MNGDIAIRHNSVHVKNVNLGKHFSNMVGELIVDRFGRVKVIVGSTFFLYTDLQCLPPTILGSISERLQEEATNRILLNIQKRIDAIALPKQS